MLFIVFWYAVCFVVILIIIVILYRLIFGKWASGKKIGIIAAIFLITSFIVSYIGFKKNIKDEKEKENQK